MMAFFLLMWLINTTSPEQKKGIADYFAPATVSQSSSGSGGVLGGTSVGSDGVQSDGSVALVERPPEAPSPGNPDSATDEAMKEAQQRRDDAAFQSAAASLRQAM